MMLAQIDYDLLIHKINDLFSNGIKNGLISIVVVVIITMILKRILRKIVRKTNSSHQTIIIKGINVALNVILLIGILYQFTFMDKLMTTLLASGGILAVVIGLASQEAASNIVSGMMIFISKPFNIGDTIIIKDMNLRGVVRDIKMNHTVIETVDNNPVLIPNTVMNKAVIENITQETPYKASYLYIDISYESDIDKAIQIIQDEIVKHPLFYDLMPSDPVKVPVHCTEFKDSGIALRAKATTKTTADGFQLCSDVRIAIKRSFDENNIEIPYPHVQLVSDRKE